MQINFWGVRGSLPVCEHRAWRYGGNTPCIEVRAGNQLFILDAGTGIRELGRRLTAEFAPGGVSAHLLLTHYHWDHIQGLPFFEPLYGKGNAIHILGPSPQAKSPSSLSGVLRELFRAPFFPISLEELKATLTPRELESGDDFTLGGIRIRTCRVNHPQGALAYRLDSAEASLVYVTDHEPGDSEADRHLRHLARGADVLVSDAQYRPEELDKEKVGWGHGSWQGSVAVARDAGAKNVVLFHHEPLRSDTELDDLLRKARRVFPNTWAASDDMLMRVNSSGVEVSHRGSRLGQRAAVDLPVRVETCCDGLPARHEAQLRNVSFYGAYLVSPQKYDFKQPVELVLSLPGPQRARAEDAELRLRGYVIHTARQPGSDLSGVAIHFPGPRAEAEEFYEKSTAVKKSTAA